MESKLRTNVSSLDSWQPVVVFVFYLNQEWVNSIIFAFDDGLCEYHRVVGNK